MTYPARLGFLLAAWVLTASVALADPAAAQPIASVALKDGRVLHNVKILESRDTSIVVHADEGLMKIMRSNLPAGLATPAPQRPADTAAGPEMVMEPFNPNQSGATQPPVPRPTPRVTPVPKAPSDVTVPVANTAFKGCTIVSFQMKAFQTVLGCAEVVIRNDTDSPALIVPGDIICVTSIGQRGRGRNLIVDGYPPIIKKSELVPPQGQVDDIVTFTNSAIEIVSVQWAK
jgi:hypothetical protein